MLTVLTKVIGMNRVTHGRVSALVAAEILTTILHGMVSVYHYVKHGLAMKCLQESNYGLVKDSISVKIFTSWISTI